MLNTNKYYIRVEADVYCHWNEEPPVYRVYVDDELFAERTFIWCGSYAVETIQLQVSAGKYAIKFEKLGRNSADFRVDNLRVVRGPGRIKSNWLLKVHDES